MSPLEIALVVLVSLWTLIFVIIAIAMIVLLIGIKKAMDKVNRILDEGEGMAHGLGNIGRAAATGVGGLIIKAAGAQIKKATSKKSARSR